MKTNDPSGFIPIIDKRIEVVDHLFTSTYEKPDLVEQIGTSRSTIDRSIAELGEFDLIRRTPKGYTLSIFGRTVYQHYRQFSSQLENLFEGKELIINLSSEDDLDNSIFESASINTADPQNPHQPIHKYVTFATEADAVTFYTPIILPVYTNFIQNRVTSHSKCTKLYIEYNVWQSIDDQCKRRMTQLLENHLLSAWIIKRRRRYSLMYVDQASLFCAIFGPKGGFKGSIMTESTQALAWAEQFFERLRADRERLESCSTQRKASSSISTQRQQGFERVR